MKTIIVNCYSHVVKNVRGNYSKYLANKTLHGTILADFKKLQAIFAEEDIEKYYELTKKYSSEAEFFIDLKFLTGKHLGRT